MFDRLSAWMDRIPLWLVAALSTGLVLGIGLADYLTGAQLSLSVFYLLPIALAAWRTGRDWSYAFSGASAAVWYFANLPGSLAMGFAPTTVLWNTLTRLGFFLSVAYLVSSTRRLLDRERELANTDSLTGLLNRRAFYAIAGVEVERARRYAHPLSMIYLDLDGFKQINDRLGHSAGDRALRSVARAVKSHVRSSDIVARLGGDELSILLPEASVEAAQAVAAKLRESVAQAFPGGSSEPTVGACQGVVTFLQAPDSVDQLVGTADRLMYAAKRSGPGGLVHQVFQGGSDSPPPLQEVKPWS
jgi:diguanylate cyclase (GGDEF)-like protein